LEPIPIELNLQWIIRQRLARQRWTGWRAAAGVVLAIGLAATGAASGWVLRGRPDSGVAVPAVLAQVAPTDRLLEEIADYHAVYARETIHQVEVPASQTTHIESWLGDRLHRRLQVPDLSRQGLQFSGARLLVVDGAPVADLMYRWPDRDHEPVALCITFATEPEASPRLDAREGIQQLVWQRNGYAYVLAGWATPTTLQRIADELMPQLDRNG
jgi:anti-sigma factor RsiW